MTIEEIKTGQSYACKFKVETMLDVHGRVPGLSDSPLKGPGTYEGLGLIQIRDMESKHVQLKDEKSGKEFIVPFTQIWDIDTVDWNE